MKKELITQSDASRIEMGESATVECYCGKPFEWTKRKGQNWWPFCPACIEEQTKRNYDECRSKLETTIANITPPRFYLTDTRNPDFNTALWKNVKPWRPTDALPWLGTVGPTGKCKTRCLFLKLREMLIESIWQTNEEIPSFYPPVSFKVVPATTFAAKVLERFSDDSNTKAAAESFISGCHETKILLLDDVDKIRVTTASGSISAAGSELHAMLDHRHSHNLTTLWSANVNPEGIVAGMPENIAGPLAGRIREASTIFNIK